MEKITLRPATSGDLLLLYHWANDPVVRASAFNTEKISLDEHKIWFEKCLADENIFIFVLILGDTPIGQVRLNVENNRQLIDYSIDSEYRGKGYGAKLLELVEEKCNVDLPLVGLVKFENIPSRKIFEKLGYECVAQKNYLEYIKNLS